MAVEATAPQSGCLTDEHAGADVAGPELEPGLDDSVPDGLVVG